jgi:ABC-type multidrug transport system ATPase subunit
VADLVLRSVSVRRGRARLLSNVDLTIRSGGLTALIGPSGSGKSTLLAVALGVLPADDGVVTLGGAPVAQAGPLGWVPQQDALHPSLRVRDELRYAAELRMPDADDDARERRVTEVLQQVGLSERARVRIGSLSGGQRRRVGVAMELLVRPALLALDEPTSGLDPALEASTMELLRDVARGGLPVVVTTHATRSLGLCRSVVVLVGGFVTYDGPAAQAAAWFGASDLDGLFEKLGTAPPEAWGARWKARR